MIKKLKEMLINYSMNDLKETISEIMRYGVIGVCTTAINILVYKFFAHTVDIYYLFANVIAWCIAVTFAFFANKFIVFRNMSTNINVIKKEYISFVGSRVLTGIIDMFLMYIFVSLFLFDDFLVKISVNILVILLNYFFAKFYVFKNKEQ